MKDWFYALESREQVMVSIGALFVVVALMFMVIWQPVAQKREDLRAEVATWQAALADLKPLRALINNGAQPDSAVVNQNQGTPIVVVAQSLQNRGLDRFSQSSQPTSSNGIRVVFEDIAFDELIVWLGDLSEKHAMHVQAGSFSAGRQAVDGRINATLTLERAL